ncbi:hypothetical protein L7F22_055628 [Adiantum nelumboides]|nr:hypothetical protein [Adiantum nelumboides]
MQWSCWVDRLYEEAKALKRHEALEEAQRKAKEAQKQPDESLKQAIEESTVQPQQQQEEAKQPTEIQLEREVLSLGLPSPILEQLDQPMPSLSSLSMNKSYEIMEMDEGGYAPLLQDPIIRPLGELDSKTLQSLLPEIPLWVKNPDYDRVDWLNKFVKDLWPYLDKAICKIIKETTQPLIKEYSAKYKIDSVEFECLTLGTLPPTLQDNPAFWEHHLSLIKFAYNTTIRSSTGKASFEIVGGARKPPPMVKVMDNVFEADKFVEDLDLVY